MEIIRLERRRLLRTGSRCLALGAALAAAPALALATRPTLAPASAGERSLAMHHLHTREKLADLVFARSGAYEPQALSALNRFLRDHYSGHVGQMDPGLFDQLHRLRSTLGVRTPFEIISGFRSEATNARLRERNGGGVARRSLHMDGRAIDIRLPGVPLAEVRDAALAMKAGGVGYYTRSQFVHLDTGRVRSW
jgi:uncharacterized protein YcbK (DUF882 family)